MHVSAEEIVKAECESCGADIPVDATECPECGTVFAEEVEEVKDEEIEEEEEELEVEKKPGKSLLVGIIIVIVGAGLALGSWLHDALKISFLGGTAYDSFGWLNQLVAVIGIIILVIGIIFVILSRKKTVIAETI